MIAALFAVVAVAADPWCAGERHVEERPWPEGPTVVIPRWDPEPEAVAVPGHDAVFTRIEQPLFDGDAVVFHGTWGPRSKPLTGLYRQRLGDGAVETIVEEGARIPGRDAVFSGFSFAAAADGRLAFVGRGGGYEGVFVAEPGGLRVIADTTMMAPERDKRWKTFLRLAWADGRLLFFAHHVEQEAHTDWMGPGEDCVAPVAARDAPEELGPICKTPEDVIGVGLFAWDGRRVSLITRNGVAPAEGVEPLLHLSFDPEVAPGRVAFTGGHDPQISTTWLVDGCALLPMR